MHEELDEGFLGDLLGALAIVDDQVGRSNDVRELGSIERRVSVFEPHRSLPRAEEVRSVFTGRAPGGAHATPSPRASIPEALSRSFGRPPTVDTDPTARAGSSTPARS
jgi:hypothetical protein